MNLFISLLTQDASTGGTILSMVIMLAVFGIMFYLLLVRPQANQDKKQKALLASLEIGDSVLTTAGFYGVIIDMVEGQDIIIVEFGNNKNCRIPMVKEAIVEVEKPEDAVATTNDTSDSMNINLSVTRDINKNKQLSVTIELK